MNETDNTFIGNRAKTLAREFLTRRPDVAIHLFDASELDFVVTLEPSKSLKVQGFSPFGAIVWATDEVLSNEDAASTYATSRWLNENHKTKTKATYFLPVIALVYSVTDDTGYYAWVSEPHKSDEGKPLLIPNHALDSTKIKRNSLDRIVQVVAEWYVQLAHSILVAT